MSSEPAHPRQPDETQHGYPDEELLLPRLRLLVREAIGEEEPSVPPQLRATLVYSGLIGFVSLTGMGALVALVLVAPHVRSSALSPSSGGYHLLVLIACLGIVGILLCDVFALWPSTIRSHRRTPLSEEWVDAEAQRLLHDQRG